MTTQATLTPVHQWTHDGDDVLILKCINDDMMSYNGFVWPLSGEVTTPNWAPDQTCESGGLLGWPWGIGIGAGKDPDYTGKWVVFAAAPGSVIDLGDKCKAGPTARVVFVGTWYAAWSYVRAGQIAWTQHASRGAASNTGDSGAASNTGDRGAASNTGYRGAASNTGDSGAASNTGYSGAASVKGDRSIASTTGEESRVEGEGAGGVAVSTADEFYWRAHKGVICVNRWATYKQSGEVSRWYTLVLDGDDFEDGVLVHVKNGRKKIIREVV